MTTAQAASTAINVEGNVSGNILVGDNNLVVNTNNGTIIYKQAGPRAQLRNFTSKPPRKPRTFIGRQRELIQLEGWIASNNPVVLYGADGLGKTTLAKQAANGPAATSQPNGVVFLEGVDEAGKLLGLNDIVQRLFDIFFESDPPLKVDLNTADPYLNQIHALVMLNSISVSSESLKALLDLFPDSPILVTTESKPFTDDFEMLSMPPLSKEDSLSLFADRSGLVLSEETRPSLESLADLLGEVPAALVMAANSIREGRTDLPALLNGLRGITPKSANKFDAALERVYTLMWDSLSPEEQQMLIQVAAAPGVSTSRPWLEQVAGGKAVSTSLESMEMLQANSPRMRLMPGMRAWLLQRDGIQAARERLLGEMLASVKERWRDFDFMNEELGNLLGLFNWCLEQQRWRDVIALGRALDPFLTLRGLWDAWQHVLTSMLDAARVVADATLEGWALHQLGTYHLALGNTKAAYDLLERACLHRRQIGDEVGLAYSQHNLGLIASPTGKAVNSFVPFLPWLIGGIVTVAIVGVAALGGVFRPAPPVVPTATATMVVPTETLIVEPTASSLPLTATFTSLPSTTPTFTFTPEPRETFTPSITPTFAILQAGVAAETADCFYGPGRFYLSLTRLLHSPRSFMQVTGRARDLDWVYVNFPGVNPGDVTRCWIQTKDLSMSGPFESLEVVYPEGSYRLPGSRWPTVVNVQAERTGDMVTVTWDSAIDDLPLGERESERSARYLVEAWLCKGGVVIFTPYPVYPYEGYIQLQDEAGCSEPSHAQVRMAEKHGYTTPVPVPWPPYP